MPTPLQSGLAAIRGVVYAGGQIGAVRVFALTGVRCRIGGLLTVERVRVGQRSSRGRRRWIGHGMGRRRARRRRCGGAAPAGGGLWLENAVMGETIRVLKADDPRLDPSMLTNWSRTRIIDAIRGEFGLARALQATGLKRGTYYYERGVIVAGDK